MTFDREITTDLVAITASADSLHLRLDASTTTEVTSNEEIVTTTREYDTDKPVDPATGTPPLKRETTETRRTDTTGHSDQTVSHNADRRSENTADISARQADSTAIQANVRGDTTAAVQADIAEKWGLNAMQRALCTVGAFTILAGLGWLGWKLRKRFFINVKI